MIVGVDPDPATTSEASAWVKDYWEALHPYSAGGAYVNLMMDEGQERVQASYRENYPRLSAIKRSTTRPTSSTSTRTSDQATDWMPRDAGPAADSGAYRRSVAWRRNHDKRPTSAAAVNPSMVMAAPNEFLIVLCRQAGGCLAIVPTSSRRWPAPAGTCRQP